MVSQQTANAIPSEDHRVYICDKFWLNVSHQTTKKVVKCETGTPVRKVSGNYVDVNIHSLNCSHTAKQNPAQLLREQVM